MRATIRFRRLSAIAIVACLACPLSPAAAQPPAQLAWEALDAGRLQDAARRFDDLVDVHEGIGEDGARTDNGT
ncbi:MAG: hypothetical protein ACLGHP_08105 [Vicinamibacteria bacterium]